MDKIDLPQTGAEWETLKHKDYASYADAYRLFMGEYSNKHKCDACPYADYGMDRNRADYAVGPCGYQICEVICTCVEVRM